MDWRLSPGQVNIDELIIKNNIAEPEFDRVVIGGAAKNLASAQQETDIDFTLRQLDIAVNLHHISKVALINHTDCGAYGGSSKFKNSDEEHQFHYEELKKAAELVSRKYPNLLVQKYLAHLEQKDDKWTAYLVRV